MDPTRCQWMNFEWPTTPRLLDYGAAFPDFLADFEPAAAAWHHVLSSMTLFTGVHGW